MLAGKLGVGQHAARFGKEDAAGPGQLHVAPVAQHEGDAEVVLELLDAAADMRLGDAELFGRMAEMQALGQGNEGPDLFEFHRWALGD